MKLETTKYVEQTQRWPQSGQHILAHFDATTVVVYQAYRPKIGHFAARNGFFGGEFKLSRMSWIKPNFLWMMYRCGWGQKEGQEVVLAIRIQRSAFDLILSQAVPSTFQPDQFADFEVWQKAVPKSEVRLQWDPDHDPSGAPLDRRAIQLGLRGSVLAKYAKDWIVQIEDISDFVRSQHEAATSKDYSELLTPSEDVYPVGDKETRRRLRMADP